MPLKELRFVPQGGWRGGFRRPDKVGAGGREIERLTGVGG